MAGRIENVTNSILESKKSIQEALGIDVTSLTFLQIREEIVNLNQENLNGRDSIKNAIISKDNKVTIPANPNYEQLVTGINSININSIDYNFTLQLRDILNISLPYNTSFSSTAKEWRFNKKNKNIYHFSNGAKCIFLNKETNTFSTLPLNFNYTVTYEIGIDGNIYYQTYYSTNSIYQYNLLTNTESKIITFTEKIYDNTSNDRATMSYALQWSNCINYAFNTSSSNIVFKKLNYLTKTATDFGNLLNGKFNSSMGYNFGFNYSDTLSALVGSVDKGCYNFNESSITLTNVSFSIYAGNEYLGGNAGYGRGFYYKNTIVNFVFEDLYSLPIEYFDKYGEIVCYDVYDNITYFYNKNNKNFSAIKIDFNNPYNSSDFILDFSVFVKMGFEVYLTIKSSSIYMRSEDNSSKILMTNKRLKVTSKLFLIGNFSSITGRIEIIKN